MTDKLRKPIRVLREDVVKAAMRKWRYEYVSRIITADGCRRADDAYSKACAELHFRTKK